ncbi:MAG: metal ABC transporter ATP-binding protein [Nocardioidaceae bacterium]
MTPSTPAIATHDLSVARAGRPVVRGVDLTVRSGELLALLGANGSGKSTLVRAVMGLLPVASGTIELLGSPLEDFHDWQRVGYVPQRSSAASGVPATVSEVVSTGLLARHRFIGWPGRTQRRSVYAALELVRLGDRSRDSVDRLSGGQQQRVMIARALVSAPDLLVLDEPTAGVDQASQQVLAEVFADLTARGTTILLVAHELGPLAPLVSRAVVLRDGRTDFEGSAVDAMLRATVGHHHPGDDVRPSISTLPREGPWR